MYSGIIFLKKKLCELGHFFNFYKKVYTGIENHITSRPSHHSSLCPVALLLSSVSWRIKINLVLSKFLSATLKLDYRLEQTKFLLGITFALWRQRRLSVTAVVPNHCFGEHKCSPTTYQVPVEKTKFKAKSWIII